MKRNAILTISAATVLLLGSNFAMAQEADTTELLDSQTALEPTSASGLNQRWAEFLLNQGWDDGAATSGSVIYLPERKLIVSSALEYTRVDKGQPGWIESRIAAFERAELEAKVKIMRFLSETTETSRSLDLLENASWSDGSTAEVEQLGEVNQTLQRLGKKSLALTDAALDNMLSNLDEDYDPADFENAPVEQVQKVLEENFNRRIKNLAMRTIVGTVPVYSTEGEDNGQYAVLVGVIWTPKLNRVAMSLFNDHYAIPAQAPGRPLREHVPSDTNRLLGTMGTRIVVDENGHLSVLAFGQAQPRTTSKQREASALQLAKQIAGERARAQVVNYIREGLSFRSDEISNELSREFSDFTVGTDTVREYQRVITSRKQRIKLRGIKVVGEWDTIHPDSGDRVAGVVVSWSPASADLSREMAETMDNVQAGGAASESKQQQSEPAGSSVPLESMKVDTSTY